MTQLLSSENLLTLISYEDDGDQPRGESPIWIQEKSLRNAAVRWPEISTALKNKPSRAQVWRNLPSENTFPVPVRHWHYNAARRCPISFSFLCFLWACVSWRGASAASKCEDHTSVSGSGSHTPICGCCRDKLCIWIVSECGMVLFRQHQRRKFNLFVPNAIDGPMCRMVPLIFPFVRSRV